MTQTADIVEELRRRGEDGLTPLEALNEFGCFRLAARISDAKSSFLTDDEYIVNVGATINGKKVARYVLRERERPALWGNDGPAVGQLVTVAGIGMRWTGHFWEKV